MRVGVVVSLQPALLPQACKSRPRPHRRQEYLRLVVLRLRLMPGCTLLSLLAFPNARIGVYLILP
jgi:hypothetical protein